MLDLQQFTINRQAESETEGVFTIGPLPPGFGHTIANPIRRILLSSLPGGSVTSIKIAGVDHEYSTLEGMTDDVLKLTLKLKDLAIKCYSDSPVIAKLEVSAPKGKTVEVTAGDITVDASVEIVNKDFVITTISDGNTLKADLTIEKGIGFRAAASDSRSEIGIIPVDGHFSPVENVEVKVENTRVGQRTDLDQATVKIRTNGVLTPEESLAEALEIFAKMASRLDTLASEGIKDPEVLTVEESEEIITETGEGVPVKNLTLSTRLRNALLNSAISDLSVLSGKTPEELLEIKGMGKKSVEELVEIMEAHGLEVSK